MSRLRDHEMDAPADLSVNNTAPAVLVQLAAPALPSGSSYDEECGGDASEPPLLRVSAPDDDDETESEFELEMDVDGEEQHEEEHAPPQLHASLHEAASPPSPGERVLVMNDGNLEDDDDAGPVTVQSTRERPGGDESMQANALTSGDVQGPFSDALLLRTVLAYPYNGTTARARIAFWDAIATAFTTAGGVGMASRADVTRRIAVLTLTLVETPHLLTPSLCVTVLEFNERNCKAGFAARLGNPFIEVLRRHANEGEPPAAHTSPAATLLTANPEMLKKRAAEDEHLMRLVFKHKPFELTQANRLATWAQIYDDYNATLEGRGPLSSPLACKRRVGSTAATLLDRKHPYHAFLSLTLRTMVVEYHLLTIPASDETAVAGTDELFMQIVLEKRASEVASGARAKAWESIAQAFTAAGGELIETGKSATRRMVNLTKMQLERPEMLSQDLRGMVLQYHELCYASSRGRETDKVRLERLRKSVQEISSTTVGETSHLSGGAAIESHVHDAVNEQAGESQDRAVNDDTVAETLDVPMEIDLAGGERGPTCAAPATVSTTNEEIHAPNDEVLMQTVLRHHTFTSTVFARTCGWDAIVHAFVAAGGVNVTSRVDATQRIGVLTLMLLESPHLLTTRLRKMLLEFIEHSYKMGFARGLGVEFIATLSRHASVGTTPSGRATPLNELKPDKQNVLRGRVLENERLMRLVMKHRPFEAGAEGKTSYWIKIVSEYNALLEDIGSSVRGPLKSVGAAQQRVHFATTTFLDRTNPCHALLTPSLRAMLVEFNMLNVDISQHTRPNSVRPGRSGVELTVQMHVLPTIHARAQVAEPTVSFTRVRTSKRRSPQEALANPPASTESANRARQHHATPDKSAQRYASTDELFMAIVLENRPCDAKTGNKLDVWNSIADAFIAAGGDRVRSGKGATTRLVGLMKMMLKSPQLLTSTLRKMILEYYEHDYESGGRSSIDSATLDTLRKHAYLTEENTTDEDGDEEGVRESAIVDVRLVPSTLTAKSTRDVRKSTASAGSKQASATSSESRLDEELMRLVLDTRPYFVRGPRAALWKDIADKLQNITKTLANGRSVDAHAVRARVEWLVKVFSDREHEEHGNLSPAVRAMLGDYTKVNHAALQQLLAALTNPAPPAVAESSKTTAVQVSLDDVLLQEVLRIRSKAGQSKAAWDRVTKTVNARVGTTVFTRGKSCKQRVQTLLTALRDHAESLGTSERKQLRQLAAMLKRKTSIPAELSPEEPTRLEPVSRIEPLSSETVDGPSDDGALGMAGISSTGRYMTMLPALDVRFMRLVVDALPFCQPTGEKMPAWDKLAAAWTAMAGSDTVVRMPTGKEATVRVQCLITVYRDRSHREHSKLTDPLKELLREYTTIKARYDAKGVHQKRQYRDHLQAKRARPEPAPELECSPPRPAKKKTKTAWTGTPVNPQAASHLAASDFGVETSVKRRKRRISPRVQEDETVQPKRQRVVDDNASDAHGNDDAASDDDDSTSLDEVAFRVALEVQPFRADYSLRGDAWDKVAWTVNRQVGRYAFLKGYNAHAHIKRVLAHFETDPESLPMGLRELAAQYNALVPSPTTSRRPRQDIAVDTSCEFAATPVCPVTPNSPTRELEADPPNEQRACDVETEVAMLRESVTRLSDQVTVLTKEVAETTTSKKDREVAAARAETAELVAEFKLERREFRVQQDALVELLKSEREAQRCETQAMMAAFDRERKDRRDKFAAMATNVRNAQSTAALANSSTQIHDINLEGSE